MLVVVVWIHPTIAEFDITVNHDSCSYGFFTGFDGGCYQRSCENFYMYAPVEWTGRGGDDEESEGDDDSSLECYVDEFPPDNVILKVACQEEDGLPAFPVAIHSSCHEEFTHITSRFSPLCSQDDHFDNGQGPSPEEAQEGRLPPRFVQMNRVCTAKPNKDQIFTCYDIAPETNLTNYFANDLDAVDSFEGCKVYQSNFGLSLMEESSLESETRTDNQQQFYLEQFPSRNNFDDDSYGFGNNETAPYPYEDPIVLGSHVFQTFLTYVEPFVEEPPTSSPPSGSSPTNHHPSSSVFLVILSTWLSIGFSMMMMMMMMD